MGTTVLLADDSITIQKVVGIIFANEDYELVVVDNGNDALEKAREIRPSVMLVDAMMPDKSGYEVCAEIRRDPALKNTPLLLLVGAFEPYEEEKARTSGIDDHITKPFESQNLLEKVHALLDLGATRVATAPAYSEEVPPSLVEMPVESEPAAAPAVSANLIEPFKSFIHLGADDVGGKEQVEPAPPVEALTPATDVPGAEGIIVLSSVDIVEAGPDDDPWGAFEEDEQVCYGEVLEEDQQGISDMVEEVEPFSLMDEKEDVEEIRLEEPMTVEDTAVSDEVSAPEFVEPLAFAGDTESTAFSEISPSELVNDEALGGEKISLGDMPVETIISPLPEMNETESQEFQPLDYASTAKIEPEFGFAPDEEYVPVTDTFSGSEQAPAVAAPAAEAAITLSEEKLAAALSHISRELIEKIVWDVVPDLAETIIREEIRKIKESIGR